MANALEHVAWESCLIEPHRDRALEAYARRKQGVPNPTIAYFASVPWLARALVDLHPEYGLLMRLDHAVADLVALVVSQENSCRFCYAAVRAMLWAQGMSRARIQRMEQDLARARSAAADGGRHRLRAEPVALRAGGERAAPARRSAHAGFGTDEMKEIAFAVAITDFSNRAHTIPAIPVASDGAHAGSAPHAAAPASCSGWILQQPSLPRPGRRRWIAVPSYPYARLVKAYAGSPIAPALARTLEGCGPPRTSRDAASS